MYKVHLYEFIIEWLSKMNEYVFINLQYYLKKTNNFFSFFDNVGQYYFSVHH